MLRSVGIAEGTANNLAAEFALDRVRQAIALAENTQATNPGGYVIRALREGWTAPKAVTSPSAATTPLQGQPAPSELAHQREILARTEKLTDDEIEALCVERGGNLPAAWAAGNLRRDSWQDMAAVLGE